MHELTGMAEAVHRAQANYRSQATEFQSLVQHADDASSRQFFLDNLKSRALMQGHRYLTLWWPTRRTLKMRVDRLWREALGN